MSPSGSRGLARGLVTVARGVVHGSSVPAQPLGISARLQLGGMPRAMSWGTEFLSGTLGGDEGMGMVNADPDADDAAAGRVSPRMGDGGAGERSHSTVTRQARPTTYAVTQQPTAATQQRPLSGWGCPLEAGRPRRRLQLQLRGRRWMEEGCGLRRPSDGSVQHTGPPTSSGLCGRRSCIIDLRRRSTH